MVIGGLGRRLTCSSYNVFIGVRSGENAGHGRMSIKCDVNEQCSKTEVQQNTRGAKLTRTSTKD